MSSSAVQQLITSIASLDVERLPSVIDLVRPVENSGYQPEVIEACLQRILESVNPGAQSTPRSEQVRTMRRLIFCKGDTLLIARTGFGKSIIFQSFSVLTRRLTLQIIPLSKLGDEQLSDIRKIPGAHPCLITADTKRQERQLLQEIKEGSYTHVLLGPEQASSRTFRAILRDPALQERIGLVAIDECHLTRQWKDFRPEFSMLGELRIILPQHVIWFGCSATIDDETERTVLLSGGFRALGSNMYQTEIIRTSIDRPDISICVRPIPKGKLTSYTMLYFLLDQCQDSNGLATPGRIPKTIVFVDGRVSVNQAAGYLQQALLQMSGSIVNTTHRYDVDISSPYCVSNIVETYTSQVSKFDRDMRYTEFKKLDSSIRIMVATTALGMGVNVADVERVVLWRLPITRDLGDYWQRLGRGGRGKDRTSIAHIFLPYWLFDTEGTAKSCSQTTSEGSQQQRVRRTLKAPARPSRLYRSQTAADLEHSDVESIRSVDSATSEVLTATQSTGGRSSNQLKYWSKQELAKRTEVPIQWLEMVNGSCYRRAFLSYLGEEKVPIGSRQPGGPSTPCCSRCTPTLLSDLTPAPDPMVPLKKPRAATRASVALQALDSWAAEEAEKMYIHPSRPFPMPAAAYMPTQCRWQLAYVFEESRAGFWESLSMNVLQEKAPALSKWMCQHPEATNPEADHMVTLLRGISHRVEMAYQEQRAQRKNPVNDIANEAVPAQQSTTVAEYATAMRMRDDSLSKRVALQEARKAAQRAQHEERQRERVEKQQEGTLASQWIQAYITGVFDEPDDPPRGVTDHMLRAARGIRQARAGETDNRLPRAESQQLIGSQPISSQLPSTPEVESDTQRCVNVDHVNSPRVPLKRRRGPLDVRDANRSIGLSYSPTTSSGRKRVLTSKGKENMRL